MLTAYDATMARLLDQAGIDLLLVGDSLGMVILGYEDTIPVTLDAMLHHTRAVANGAKRALVVADLPFLTYQVTPDEAVLNSGRLLQGGAAAVKMEGGLIIAETVARVVRAGIPVMGHIGLTPQSVRQLGGFRYAGRTPEEANALVEDALALEAAGVFSMVLECIPEDVAARITAAVKVPTIGIGAGAGCDGQVLVCYDALGLFEGFVPGFVRQYAHLATTIRDAVKEYVADVREGRFPASSRAVTASSETNAAGSH
jgi:3-methyl-2-oxobutanoate hydroxymethyltransferase